MSGFKKYVLLKLQKYTVWPQHSCLLISFHLTVSCWISCCVSRWSVDLCNKWDLTFLLSVDDWGGTEMPTGLPFALVKAVFCPGGRTENPAGLCPWTLMWMEDLRRAWTRGQRRVLSHPGWNFTSFLENSRIISASTVMSLVSAVGKSAKQHLQVSGQRRSKADVVEAFFLS